MRLFLSCFLLLVFRPMTWAQVPSMLSTKPAPKVVPPAKEANDIESSRFEFSLLPKAFQKNPGLEVTVMGEVTEEGKKLPPVSPENSTYFTLFSAGYHPVGDEYGEKTLTEVEIERILTRSLATDGYLAAKAPVQPSLLIIYTWGSHNRVSDVDDPGVRNRNFLERAALVGGEKFAVKAADMLEQQADQQQGGFPAFALALINPFHIYEMTSVKHAFMLDQARSQVYYVIASAYDYGSAAKRQRRLLWRTRMTVDSSGVSQPQTLPALIVKAAPFFGKETAEPEILTPNVREGQVKIGTPRVVDEAPASSPGESAPAKETKK